MSAYSYQDHWLAAIGISAAIWCICLTLYSVISDSRQKSSSLHTVTESFGSLLIALGERLRDS